MWLVDSLKPEKENPPLTSVPSIAVIFAAFNEDRVIEEKINSIYKTNYPLEKLKVYIGSDASTDKTDEIVIALQEKYTSLNFTSFKNRMGKAGIINALAEMAHADILVGTDANIIFTENTLTAFAESFTHANTKIVAGNIIYFEKSKDGISNQEGVYLSIENKIKKAESKLWRKVMGVSGGLYAIRKEAFTTIPSLTFMEDFFVSFSVLQNKGDILAMSESTTESSIVTADLKINHKRQKNK